MRPRLNDNRIEISPGLALDHFGNEILVCQPQYIDLECQNIPGTAAPEKSFFICLKYKECLAEPVPKPVEECGSSDTDCEYNRIRETFAIEAVEEGSERYDELKSQCHDPFEAKIDIEIDCIRYLGDDPATPYLPDVGFLDETWGK